MSDKLKVEIDGKVTEIPLPPNHKLREQNADCTRKGCLCGIIDGNLVCIHLAPKVVGKNLQLAEIQPCSHNPDGKIIIHT